MYNVLLFAKVIVSHKSLDHALVCIPTLLKNVSHSKCFMFFLLLLLLFFFFFLFFFSSSSSLEYLLVISFSVEEKLHCQIRFWHHEQSRDRSYFAAIQNI